jgi:aminoglycoside phosphotransferase (APT) family kinase protein
MDPPAPSVTVTSTFSTDEVRAIVEAADAEPGGGGRRVTSVRRRTGMYVSSAAVEELDAVFDDGTELPLVLKDLTASARLNDAARTKPAFLYDPRREFEVYRRVLWPNRVGVPRLHGSFADPAAGRYALLLERVEGDPLWQVGHFDTWLAAARWLAAFHARFAGDADALAGPAHLLRYDAGYYRVWITRAVEFATGGRRTPDEIRSLEELARGYDRVVDRLLAQPRTVIHGEFYASNILVKQGPAGVQILPVDWEMTATAPPLMDLADLSSGKWSDREKQALALAYHSAAAEAGAPVARTAEAFFEDLDLCRLHRAVQWLGWAADWTPPREHAQDWLGEALRLSRKFIP